MHYLSETVDNVLISSKTRRSITSENIIRIMETIKDWLGTFWKILIAPTAKTFVEEAEKAQNKFASAILWSVFIAICSYLIPAMAGQVFNGMILIFALLIFPLVIVLVPSVAHFMLQRVFRRKQYLYDKILYIFTAILVLFQLIVNISFFMPTNISTVFNYIIVAYQIVLLIVAVKAVAKVNYWQAVSTILASFTAGALIFICALPFISV